jgi:hypothetical protein
MEVVDEPLGSGRDCALATDCVRESLVGIDENTFILWQPRQKTLAAPSANEDFVLDGQQSGVLFEMLDAVQLTGDGSFIEANTSISLVPEQLREQSSHIYLHRSKGGLFLL